jgi:hypothetical protein
MSENRNYLIDGGADEPRRLWRRRLQVAAFLVVAVFGAGAAFAAVTLHPAKEPGPAVCAWGALMGSLGSAPKFVLAFDKDFSVQPFFQSGVGGHSIPVGDNEEPPTSETPNAEVEVQLQRFGTSSIICVKMNGDRKCFEAG